MYFKSKKVSLLILAITSILLSRTLFFFFDDPEGPNLLIVIGLALVLYLLSLTVYLFDSSITGIKRLLLAIFVQILLVTGLYFIGNNPAARDHKSIEYKIEGTSVRLGGKDYFGNELITDLDGDAKNDIVFIATQQNGGSGTFFYALAALKTKSGYIGSDGYFLGDRIAPQTINISPNPRHKNVIVVNYSDRKAGEPMTAQPSVGKSVYLKLDSENMRWGIVEQNFEGESR